MRERPIIFNSEMVRALLDGRKTQTRRAINWRRTRATEIAERDDGSKWPWSEDCENGGDYWHDCPFGAVGDRLWVRETWQGPLFDTEQFDAYMRDSAPFETSAYCEYAADGGPRPEYFDADDNLRQGWKPSIHMPRWASRITLEIIGVRVERLKNISAEDARQEGVIAASGPFEAQLAFHELWRSIYGQENWSTNPWVWAIEFIRRETQHGN